MLWLVLANALSASACPAPALAVDLSRLEGLSDREVGELYTSLLVRVVEEHYAVSAPGEPSAAALRLIRSPGGALRIEVVLDGAIRTTTVAAADSAHVLAIVHASIELLREAGRARAPCATAAAGGAGREAEITVGPAIGGALTIAPRAQIAVALTPGSRLRIATQVTVAAPLDTPAALSVREAGAALGLGLAIPVRGSAVAWHGAALIGAWFQHHRYASPAGGRDITDHVDPVLIVDTGITVAVHAQVALGASVGVLAVTRGYEHRQDGALLYQTARVRPLAGVSIAYRF